jgi:hypothetical protein
MMRQDGSRRDIGWAPTYAQEKLPIKIGLLLPYKRV